MFTVTFVCLGNICRSPMAEAVFKKMVEEEGLAGSISVNSFGTSDCEEGNPVYPPVASLLRQKGYDFKHYAKMIGMADVKNSDYILVMDRMNFDDLMEKTGGNYADKIFMLGHFLPERIEIDDPWYTRDFARTYSEICASCRGFLEYLKGKHANAFSYDKRHGGQ